MKGTASWPAALLSVALLAGSGCRREVRPVFLAPPEGPELTSPGEALLGSGGPLRELTLGLHVSAWSLFAYDWAGKLPGDTAWTGEASHPGWRENVVRNLDLVKERGYNVLLLDVMATERGAYFFESDLLKEKGYFPYFDGLGFIVGEAHGRGLDLYADHTILAWRLDDYQTGRYEIGGGS